jgi:hypothetical protein
VTGFRRNRGRKTDYKSRLQSARIRQRPQKSCIGRVISRNLRSLQTATMRWSWAILVVALIVAGACWAWKWRQDEPRRLSFASLEHSTPRGTGIILPVVPCVTLLGRPPATRRQCRERSAGGPSFHLPSSLKCLRRFHQSSGTVDGSSAPVSIQAPTRSSLTPSAADTWDCWKGRSLSESLRCSTKRKHRNIDPLFLVIPWQEGTPKPAQERLLCGPAPLRIGSANSEFNVQLAQLSPHLNTP